MSRLEFIVKDLPDPSETDIRQVGVRSDGEFLTSLVRSASGMADTFLHAPPAPLGFWVLDNWWRILYEPETFDLDTSPWRLAHEMASIGGGHVWPPITFWGEGSTVGVRTRSQDLGTSCPVQYTANHRRYYPIDEVESSFDLLTESLISESIADHKALEELHLQIKQERADPDVTDWRVLEAELGFDADDGPADLITRLGHLGSEFGRAAISEASVSRQGEGALTALEHGLEAVAHSKTKVDLSNMDAKAAFQAVPRVGGGRAYDPVTPPWKHAEEVASVLRQTLSIPYGPISDQMLGDVLGISRYRLRQADKNPSIPYGLRLLDPDSDKYSVVLNASRIEANRFKLCRVLGDIMWSSNEQLGVISDAKSIRQKFQRAFAQSFLCPYNDLQEYIGSGDPTLDDITAAARKFRVSERMIKSILANKDVICRCEYDRMIASEESWDTLVTQE